MKNEKPLITAVANTGTLELFTNRICIKRRGIMALGLQGDKDIALSQISSIQFKKAGMMAGYIKFAFLGGQESKGHVSSANFMNDENTIMFSRKQQPEFERIKEAIENHTFDQATSNTHSNLNDLEKLADLRDKGIITQAEFEAKKKQILGEKQPIATLRSLPQEEGERMKVLEQIQAPEEKKKRKIPKWVPIGCGSLILLIIIIFVIGTVTGSKNNTTTQTASSTTAETSSTKITNPALAFQPIKYTSDENKPDNNGEAKLAPFSVPTQDWVIDWSYTPSGDGVFSFFVYPNYGADTNTAVATVLFPDTTSGSLTCSRGPGQYQIVMVTGCNWSITIHPQQ